MTPSKTKVFFATAEDAVKATGIITGGVNYGLFTVFPFICSTLGLKAIDVTKNARIVEHKDIPKILAGHLKKTIIDSGIFTFCYGKGISATKKDIVSWYESYIKFVNDNVSHRTTMVEVDCQHIAGADLAWQLRQALKVDCPNHVQINVWHPEDGESGLEKLVEFSDYIAVSVNEYIRGLGLKKATNFVKSFVNRCKTQKKDIRIHLLGCTRTSILNLVSSDVDSVDSRSWSTAAEWGGNCHVTRGIMNKDTSIYDAVALKNMSFFCDTNKLSKRLKELCGKFSLLAAFAKKRYQDSIGNQD